MDTIRPKLITGARITLGLVFAVFGLNGFLQFLPMPAMGGSAEAFLGALGAAGYVWPLVKGIEVLAGLALLGNRFVPLALTLLAPIVVNIVAFHTVLAPASPVAFLVVGLGLYLAWAYRDNFRGVLAVSARPTTTEHHAVVRARAGV